MSSVEEKQLIAEYLETILDSKDPVFRTCEVLTRIDNLFLEKRDRPLGYSDKIHFLKNLKKKYINRMQVFYLIHEKQRNPNKTIIALMNDKIELYKIQQDNEQPPPRVYDRKRRAL